MPILGLSEKLRLPRAGIIRLGIKKKNPKTGKEYPDETEHFVVPEIVEKQYGPTPKSLVIMFPVENEEVFFQQWYKRYGNGILLCKGDGVEANAWDFDRGEIKKISCPCKALEERACKPVGCLQFLLPEVDEAAAVFQINTSSKNSIIDVNSGIKFIRAIAGRIAMIPLLLKREPIDIHRIEGKELKTGRHYTMKLSLEGTSLQKLQLMGKIKPSEIMLPAPDESQPEDLFPANGFKPEESVIDADPEEEGGTGVTEETKRIADLRDQLAYLMADLEQSGVTITKAEMARANSLKEESEYLKAIEYFKGKTGKKAQAKDGKLF